MKTDQAISGTSAATYKVMEPRCFAKLAHCFLSLPCLHFESLKRAFIVQVILLNFDLILQRLPHRLLLVVFSAANFVTFFFLSQPPSMPSSCTPTLTHTHTHSHTHTHTHTHIHTHTHTSLLHVIFQQISWSSFNFSPRISKLVFLLQSHQQTLRPYFDRFEFIELSVL